MHLISLVSRRVWLLLASSVLGVCISMHRLETLNFVEAEMADHVECELIAIVTYFVTGIYLHKLCPYNCMYSS